MGDESIDSLRIAVDEIKKRAEARGRGAAALEFRYTLAVGEAESALRSISHSIDVDEPPMATMRNAESADEVAETISRFKTAGFTEL